MAEFGWLRSLVSWRWWLGINPPLPDSEKIEYGITVVIPAYNEEHSIAATIKSVQAQSVPVDRIIVVDDCSTDHTGEVATNLGVEVMRTPTNQGTKASAQNYVLDQVTTELLVTLDADTLMAPEAIERTLPPFSNPKVASVCGFVIPQKIKTMWERARFIEYIFGLVMFKRTQDWIGAVLVSSGCFSTFRTKILQELGGFQARTMAEDMDFSWEAQTRGYSIRYVGNAYCFPLDPPTRKIYIQQIDRWYRSFFQAISLHSFRRRWRLGALVYGYLLEGLLAPLLTLIVAVFLTKHIWEGLLLGFVLDFLVVTIPCCIKGIATHQLKEVITSVPFYFAVVRPVNLYVFYRAFWREWIRRDHLRQWAKGH